MRQKVQQQLVENVYKQKIEISSMEPLNIANANFESLSEEFVAEKYKKSRSDDEEFLGFNPLHLKIKQADTETDFDLVVNGKKHGGFLNVIKQVILKQNLKLQSPIEDSLLATEFNDIYKMDANYLQLQLSYPQIADYTPKYYGKITSDDNQLVHTIEELITGPQHLNECHNTDNWPDELFIKSIDGMCNLHAIFYDKAKVMSAMPWLIKRFSLDIWQQNTPLWQTLAMASHKMRPDIIKSETIELQRQCIAELGTWYAQLEHAPTTIIHGDFNPRNICFRQHQAQQKVCILDWECAREHVPQFDIVQFLLYSSNSGNVVSRARLLFDHARNRLSEVSGYNISAEEHLALCHACIQELLISRIPLLVIIFKHFNFSFDYGKRLIENATKLLMSDVFKG